MNADGTLFILDCIRRTIDSRTLVDILMKACLRKLFLRVLQTRLPETTLDVRHSIPHSRTLSIVVHKIITALCGRSRGYSTAK